VTVKLNNVYVVAYEDEEVCHLSSKIGVALDGGNEGMHIYLDAIPMNGHLYIGSESSLSEKLIIRKGESHENKK
jgi:hypothetical protein